MKQYFQLLRINQWYKNLVVFLAIFFSGNLFNLSFVYLTVLAFISLCLISSAGYIINDWVDLKKDRLHPEKKLRPLVSGKISKSTASILIIILLVAGFGLGGYLRIYFVYIVTGLFILTQIYTFFLKKIIFADTLTIATLFVIRAVSGAVVINVIVSPWLILCPFFLALFLTFGKRHADLLLMKDNAAGTRKVLKEYNSSLTNSLMIISTTLLIISYALYSFLSEHQNLLYSLPFALFVIFRFYYLINSGSIIARSAEKVVKDKAMMVGIILWVLMVLGLVY